VKRKFALVLAVLSALLLLSGCKVSGNPLPEGMEEETVLDWSHTEGYPTDGWIDGVGQVTMGETHRVYRTESLARFAYSVFYRAVKFAEENRVPILMDY